MGFDVWKLGIQAKIGLLKADIKGKYREKQCNRYIRKTRQETTASIVTTKKELEYYLRRKYNLIYIEEELYWEMANINNNTILDSVGKTISKIGKTTTVVDGITIAGISPVTIPLLLSSMFVGGISKSDLDIYQYIVNEDEERIILKHKSYNPIVDEDD